MGWQDDQVVSQAPAAQPALAQDEVVKPRRQVRSLDVQADGSLVPTRSDYGARDLPQTDQVVQAVKNVGQAGAQAATGMTGAFAGDVAGLGALAYDVTANALLHPFSGSRPSQYADPAAVRERVASALTYQPSDPNNLTSKALQYPGQVMQGAGEFMAQASDNPYVQDVLKAGPQALASYMGIKAVRPPMLTVPKEMRIPGQQTKVPVPEQAAPPPIAGKTPEERARNYVESRTNLAWDTLSAKVRQQLTDIAKSSGRLEQLDATAVERQAVLSGLDRPITNATRGQITRDPLQQRREQLLKSTEQGTPLRQIDIEQNARLLENLDVLRGKTGAKATSDIEAGRSIQDTLRTRFNKINVEVGRRYKEAEKAGELQGPVNIDRLVEYLKNHEDPAQVSYAMSRLQSLGAIKVESNGGITVSQNRPLTLAQLEGIRRAAVAAGKDGGTKGHYAGELKSVIDDITEGAGGEKYQEARAFRRAMGNEFERQKAVERLVSDKHMSTDRAVALEDTWHRTVLGGSTQDLNNVMESLYKSGADGQRAIADLQGATVDYITNKATGGKLGMRNQSGDLNATWSGIKRAVDDVGEEKMALIFGKEQSDAIYRIVDAAQILKTEAPMLVKGSPTIDKLLTLLDRVPVAGPTVSGGIRIVQKAGEIGRAGREIRNATTNPLDTKR